MHVVVVKEQPDGKISLTKDELQKMLDEAYEKGKADNRPYYWWNTQPYAATTDKITVGCGI